MSSTVCESPSTRILLKQTSGMSVENNPAGDKLSIKAIRNAIPDHCFKPSWTKSIGYVLRDLFFVTLFSVLAWRYIPSLPSLTLRCVAWALYGYVQGFVFTGFWVLAHELGHGATLPSSIANDSLGFVIHSCLLTPYFAWKSTHSKHHRYTGHMQRDPNHIPLRYEDDTASNRSPDQSQWSFLSKVEHLIEDTPFYVLARLLFQQICGWPMYLACSIAAAPQSCDYRSKASSISMSDWLRKCHFNPWSSMFTSRETVLILLSDIGTALVSFVLWRFGTVHGFGSVFLLYGQPWLWVNHWITMVTFLHHTHPEVPKFEAEAWTYVKGATATVDRDFGFVGRFFFHNVIDFHVVHHLFPKIPFYHAGEATRAIQPVLGKAYHVDRTGYFASLWREFSTCQWVTSDNSKKVEDRALWFVSASQMAPASSSCGGGSPLRLRRRLATWWKL